MASPTVSKPNLSELYKLRAQEYLARYESMRSLEWKIVFQTYAGYAMIAAAFTKSLNIFLSYRWFSVLAMVATCTFFAAIQYLYFRIQERLIVFNEAHEACMRKAGPPSGIGQEERDEVEKSLKDALVGQESLGHRYFWTYDMQSLISMLGCIGLLAYEFFRSGLPCETPDRKPIACPVPWVLPSFWSIFVLPAFFTVIMRLNLGIKLGKIKAKLELPADDWISQVCFSIYSKLIRREATK